MMNSGPVVLNRMPFVSFYAKIKGWPYVISWCHRIAGLFLVAYLWFHIYTLLSLSSPPLYNATMKIYRYSLFAILEWGLGLPVICHDQQEGTGDPLEFPQPRMPDFPDLGCNPICKS